MYNLYDFLFLMLYVSKKKGNICTNGKGKSKNLLCKGWKIKLSLARSNKVTIKKVMFLYTDNKVRTWNLTKYDLKFQKHEILKDIF